MGSGKMLYLSDDAIVLLDKVPNMSELVDQLIKQHFSNDEEVLKEKLLALERESARLKAALQDKIDERLQRQTRERNRVKDTNEEKSKRLLANSFADLWKENKIDDNTYWACFPNGLEPLYDKMKEIIADKNKSA